MKPKHKVRVLINPNSGTGTSLDKICHALIEHWEQPGNDLAIQFSTSKEDGQTKARNAVEDGVSTLLVVGGDGMINSIGSVLIDTETALGVIPAGSGNGLARHFDIPLDIAKAAKALAAGKTRRIDVGYANELPFFITCSLAWDAALVKVFDRSPVRGILPYIFSAVYEFFEYTPQPFSMLIDGKEKLEIEDPMLCTIANLTQYGGGAQIAPGAQADDGQLQLVTLKQSDLPWVVPLLGKIFDGTIDQLQQVNTRSFCTLTVERQKEGPMQLDGELVPAPAKVVITVRPRALKILVP